MDTDVQRIYGRARAASKALKEMPVSDRAACMQRLKAVILEKREHIIDVIQRDTGKCRTDALVSEIFSVLDHLSYLEKHAAGVLADRKVPTPLVLLGKKSRIYFEPLGVVLVISPWNYPFNLGVVPATSAFTAGNAVVYKPSEHTPMKGLLEELLQAARFPTDAVQVVYGAGDTGGNLIEGGPDKIFFTGSVATGKRILAQAAPLLIPVDLELGGKDPMIVFADANIERAVAGAMWGAFTNTGQACTSVERLYVEESIYGAFRDKLVSETLKLTQAVDSDGNADMGKITADFQVKKIKEQLDEAKAKGARLLTGDGWDGHSPLMPPMVVEGAPLGAKVIEEETFGPVLPIIPFRSEDEVVAAANRTPYGLSASVWTADRKRAERVARGLNVGGVSVNNVMLTEGNAALPFGGVKHSGMGRYKGEFGLYAFSSIKSILIDGNSGKIESNWYPYTTEKYRMFSSLIANFFRGGLVSLVKGILVGLKLEAYSSKAGRRGREL